MLQSETRAALDRVLADAQRGFRTPWLIGGVTRGGELVHVAAAGGPGDAAAEATDPAQVAGRIGSITKTFTAVLVMRLRDEGGLALTDPLDRYVPGTRFGDRSLASLLMHRGGVQAEAGDPWWERVDGRDWATLVHEVAAAPTAVVGEADRRFHYSNLGFAALGRVVEVLRGSSWFDAVTRELLQPLEMQRTSYHPVPPHTDGFAVHPYADLLLPEPHTDTRAMAPAGQLWASVGDLAVWSRVLLDGAGVLAGSSAAEMRDALDGYGLGVALSEGENTRSLVGHYGSMPGFQAGLLIDVETRDAAATLGNSTAGYGDATLALLDVLDRLEPPARAAWQPVDATIPADLLACVGPWYWGPRAHVLRLVGTEVLDLAGVDGRDRAARFTRDAGGTWRGRNGYYTGEPLVLPADGTDPSAVLRIGTFVFTRAPYASAAVPGGVDPQGWRGR